MSFGWVIIIFAVISSLSQVHVKVSKYSCTLTKYSLKEHVPAWFPILLSSFNKTKSMYVFQYTYYNNTSLIGDFWGNIENRYPKTLTPRPSCIFMSSLLLLMSNVNIFQFNFLNLIHSNHPFL